MAYPNLKAELARNGITQIELAEAIGRDKSTVSILMNGGHQGFTIKQSQIIRDKFFPDFSIDYLFSEEPIKPKC